MKKASLILFMLINFVCFSQSKFQVEVDFGFAFQNKMMLNNESLESDGAIGVRFGINYLKMFNDKFYIETGVYGKYNRGNREIETLSFTFNSFKIQIPIYLGYEINDIWKLSFGASIENNRHSENFDFTREDNLRYDFLTKLVYKYTSRLDFSFHTHWMLNATPDTFTISSPKNGMYLGVIYKFGKIIIAKED